MKRSMIFLMIFVFSVFSVVCLQPQAAEKAKKTRISYNKKPIKVEQLKRDFKKQWPEVLKSYPAVAIAFMRQEALIASMTRQSINDSRTLIGGYISTSDSIMAVAVETSVRLNDCIDKFIMCDIRAGSDGGYSVDEVNGCMNSFSDCWNNPPDRVVNP